MSTMMRDLTGGLWAMPAEHAREYMRQFVRALPGLDFKAARAEAEASIQAQIDDPRVQLVGTIAVIPICGCVMNRGSIWSYLFGGAVISVIRAQLRKALADEAVKAIVFRIDSPGGLTDGVTELAAEIFKSRGIKPITSIADTMAASAAYWLGSSADEFVASPSAFVGSVGVFCEHEDLSKLLEAEGINIEVIASSDEKVEDHYTRALSEEAFAHKKAIVDQMAAMFVADVARGRQVTPKQVRESYGQGRAFLAKEAKDRGLVDRVATFEDTIARLAGGSRKRSMAAMSLAVNLEPGAAFVVNDATGDVVGIQTASGEIIPLMLDEVHAHQSRAVFDQLRAGAQAANEEVPRIGLEVESDSSGGAPAMPTESEGAAAVPVNNQDAAAADLERARAVVRRMELDLLETAEA